MKKSLVFAMAMALGVSATAFAANPFSDVPAGHWAYAAVAKLAAAGIVDGYPDGTYKGDRTMTRYEMAQIIAKALAKGAIGADDKLVSEFADELDNLGVRVAKLEKNADNVRVTGAVRLSYEQDGGGKFDGDDDKSASRLRTRLFFTGEVNDNWHYVALLENNQYFQGQNENGEDDTDFQRAYLQGNIGVVNVTAGRFNAFYGDGNIFDDRADAIEVTVPFGDAHFRAAYGKMANSKDYTGTYGSKDASDSIADKFWTAELGGTWGNFDLTASYLKADDVYQNDSVRNDDKIWTAQAVYHPGKFYLGAMYLKGDDDSLKGTAYPNGDDDGYVVKMGWAGAQEDKPGSWGLYTSYYDQGAPTVIAHTMNGPAWKFNDGDGFKGWMVGGNLTVAKNMVAQVEYYDLKSRDDNKTLGIKDGDHNKTLWSQLVVTF